MFKNFKENIRITITSAGNFIGGGVGPENRLIPDIVRLINNDISFCEITSFEKGQIDVWENKLGSLVIKSSMGFEDDRKINYVSIRKNIFKSGISNLGQCILEHDFWFIKPI